MTLVIAHKSGWMVADKRATYSGETWPLLVNKIHRFRDCLVASCGDSSVRTKLHNSLPLQHGVTGYVEWINQAQSGSDNTRVLCVRKGHLELFTGGGCIETITQDWWAIGSGAHIAYGYLTSVEEQFGSVIPRSAVNAIVVASRLLPGVSAEFDSEKIDDNRRTD